ncbi:MAG TPA: HEAT repeat domain-containing protein [Thermoanaerobaculaceae bacterium]|nr:HEAT repeat domain-containing protein [Thermoanaerobaculaceae bacterium]
MRRLLACLGAAICCAAAAQSATTPTEARAQVLALADARRFDAVQLDTLAHHADPGVREAVARTLGELANPGGVPLLSGLARDPEADVRAAAAQGAGRLASLLPEKAGEREALGQELRRLLQDPVTGVRAAAAWGVGMALVSGSDLWVLQRLSLEKSPVVQAAVLQELWRLPGTLWIKRATTFMTAKDARVRLAAAWSLARSGHAEAVAGLKQAAGDADPLVRMVALEGARRVKTGALWTELLAGVTDADARVRIAALQGLGAALTRDPGRTLPPQGAERLKALVADADPNRVQERVAAIRLAGSARCCLEQLKEAMAGGESWVSGEALIAFARLGEIGSDQAVREWFASKELPRRLAAVRAFPSVNQGQRLLTSALADSQVAVRLAALAALHEDASPAATAAINQRLTDEDPAVRAAAVKALAGRKALPATVELLRLLEREDGKELPDAAVALVTALGESDPLTDEARSALEKLVGSPAPVVARAAWGALLRRGVQLPLPEVKTGENAAFYTKVVEWAARSRWLEVVTVRGTLQIALDTASAPLTCFRLVSLSDKKFFEDLTFHRVEPNFVVQGGDPRGDGWGGPGFAVRDELSLAPYESGGVGIALSGPDTGGSQIFVTLTPRPHLLGRYPHVGALAAGLEVCQRLRVGDRILRTHAGEGPLPAYYPIWYGPIAAERLDREVAGWREEREGYKPQQKWVDMLGTAKLRYGLAVAMGTWCGDSREQIPRLQAVLRALGQHSPFEEPRYVGTDRSKSIDARLYPFGVLELVPTIVVTVGGSEVGRIVETPKSGSIEEDLVRILAPVEGWELPNG